MKIMELSLIWRQRFFKDKNILKLQIYTVFGMIMWEEDDLFGTKIMIIMVKFMMVYDHQLPQMHLKAILN
jgi:hypothetical protein